MNIKELIKERRAENKKLKQIRLEERKKQNLLTAKYREVAAGQRARKYYAKGGFWGTLHTDLLPKNRERTARNIRAMLFGRWK